MEEIDESKYQLRETVTTIKTPISVRDPLVKAVMVAFGDAQHGESSLPPHLLALPGMSGRKYRGFVNDLIRSLVEPRYLEVGVHAGSTLCAAIYHNDVEAVGIDDYSLSYAIEDPQGKRQMVEELQNPRFRLSENLARFRGQARVEIIESDFRKVDFAKFRPFNVYLFDGPHEEQDQYDGLVRGLPALAERFVFIVDDWNWEQVRKGTLTAIQDCELDWLCGIEVFTQVIRMADDAGAAQIEQMVYGNPFYFQNSDWHNGYFIGVFTRRA